ncbi:hypothetical protein ACQBAU_18400 [Propionibacteriaceae bacterium Y2011]
MPSHRPTRPRIGTARTAVTVVVSLLMVLSTLTASPRPAVAEEGAAPPGMPDNCALPPAGPKASSPITGYFVLYDSDYCDALQKMAGIRAVGGDTVITFGHNLRLVEVDETGRVLGSDGSPDPQWTDCLEGGVTCVRAARNAVPGATVDRVLRYSSPERLGEQTLRCTENGRDAEVINNGIRYQRLLLPADGAEDTDCTAEHSSYDLVLIRNGAVDAPDPTESMLAAADRMGLEFHIGMPVPGKDPKAAWLPDGALLGVTGLFSARLFRDWAVSHADHPSFVGVYQSTEIPMKSNAAWDAGYDLYTVQHHLAADLLPGKSITISPYVDARPHMGVPIEMSRTAFIRMANTAPAGTAINIAPQDGRGTSKVGAYFPDEIDNIVDPQLWPLVGEVTYREAYRGTTGEYYSSAAAGRAELANPDAELWYNIELMRRGVGEGQTACDPSTGSIAATWDQVSKQVSVAGNHATKVIAFMYDRIATCTNPGIPSLVDQLLAAEGRPIPNSAAWVDGSSRSRAGVLITGYDLGRATATISYRSTDGSVREQHFSRSELRWHPTYGRQHADTMAIGVQALTAPLARPADLDPEMPWLEVSITNPAGSITYGTYRVVPG